MQTPVRRSMQTLCRLSALLSKGTTRGLCDVSVSACSTGNVARSTRSRHPQALRNPETSLGMQALAKLHPEPGLWKCEVDRPSISREEVLIRVKSSSLCGTDLHIYHWDQWSRSAVRPPVILGHEFFGTVEEVGDGVVGIEKGQRVTAEGHITCGHCRNCRAAETRHLCRYSDGIGISRNGGFAEFVSVPSQNVIKLPNEIRDDMAACMDPLGNAVHSALSFDLVSPWFVLVVLLVYCTLLYDIMSRSMIEYLTLLLSSLNAALVCRLAKVDKTHHSRDLQSEIEDGTK